MHTKFGEVWGSRGRGRNFYPPTGFAQGISWGLQPHEMTTSQSPHGRFYSNSTPYLGVPAIQCHEHKILNVPIPNLPHFYISLLLGTSIHIWWGHSSLFFLNATNMEYKGMKIGGQGDSGSMSRCEMKRENRAGGAWNQLFREYNLWLNQGISWADQRGGLGVVSRWGVLGQRIQSETLCSSRERGDYNHPQIQISNWLTTKRGSLHTSRPLLVLLSLWQHFSFTRWLHHSLHVHGSPIHQMATPDSPW